MNNAANVVNLLLETDIVRVCMYCDQTNPLPVQPGQHKSHGVCRKHVAQYVRDTAANPEAEAQMRASLEAKPDSSFAPTHESVDPSVAQRFAQATGLTLHPEVQYGSMQAGSLDRLSPAQRKEMETLASWEFTEKRPGAASGITFYIPVNASYDEMMRRWEQKKQEFNV